jgi:hypothetical protein
MSRLLAPHRISGFSRQPSFGLRSSVFGLLIAAHALQPHSLLACAACFGQSDSPMAAGMNWGILSLLAMIGVVLGGIVAFFVFLARRSAAASPRPATAQLAASAGGTWQSQRSAAALERSEARKHWLVRAFHPAGRVRHTCARGRAHAGPVAFDACNRTMGPESTNPLL